MKNIISLFQRNYDGDHLVRDEVVPGAEWVQAGEGVATRKFDGTCCLLRGGRLYKRHTIKSNSHPWPEYFESVESFDSGKHIGWVPVGDGPEDEWYREALANLDDETEVKYLPESTWELCGPKIQGNPESLKEYRLFLHNYVQLLGNPRTFDELKLYLKVNPIEGIVWHHSDGRMVKIKGKDFGFKRIHWGD